MKTIEWRDGAVRFLDQTRLPHEEVYVVTRDVTVLAEAIRSLRIRGAPLIGVAAAYGVALEAHGLPSDRNRLGRILQSIELLRATRPTAVNLFKALDRMRLIAENCSGAEDLGRVLLDEANAIRTEDVQACRRISEFGAALLRHGTSVLTHCNAGALATAGVGTALGVITRAHDQGKITRVYVDETRPLLQGGRLTTWELLQAGIETYLITDSAAGVVMAGGMVQAVVVGADRIAANGDVANKVGTYTLAVLASRHGIPIYVAAPLSTVDLSTPSGGDIVIEQRDPAEVTRVAGAAIAPEGVHVFSPAFDITPNELITAIVTETGVHVPPYGLTLAGS